ncbi:MAG: bifunctional 4-hydroxy-2-oxoglutarate aldolase/2-dehydro-3-deoxy-phosphogluconate aldolase [Pseudomonadota bacterium]
MSKTHRPGPMAAILARGPVLPVLVIDDLAAAVPLARALYAGGIDTLEVTLRTTVALDAVRAIRDAVPEVMVGVGSVSTLDQFADALRADAAFAVSPGSTPELLEAADYNPMPLLPGATTPTEIMAFIERGTLELKFFPAELAGGARYLEALSGPLPQVSFCPTGGINAVTAASYLALDNVLCVGGSWVAPADAVATRDWARISKLAEAATQLRKR